MEAITSYYNDQQINELLMRLDIVDIVSETVKLTRKGNRYWGRCPFHQEKTASFSVTPDKNLFYCFGCHAGGNIFTYVMKRDGLEFKEAVEMLASKAGIELVQSKNKKYDEKRKNILEINHAAAEFYYQHLMGQKNSYAWEYLNKRKVGMDTCTDFKIGYAPDKWNVIEEYLLKKGFSERFIKESGIIKRSSQGDRYFDLFRNRIIFPIQQYNGEIVGFGGRVLDDGVPKYLNSPETEVYSKRNNLYGLFQARETIRRENEFLLVEGYLDCIKLYQNGIRKAVASLGTSLTIEQASLLRRYAEKAVVLYDGDEAGQREAIRAIDILREQDFMVDIVTLPGGSDPDEYLDLYGKEEFLHYIQNNKINCLEFKINRAVESEKDLDLAAVNRIINTIKNEIKTLHSEIDKDYYIKLLAKRLKLEENLVRREITVQNGPIKVADKNKSPILRNNIKYGNYSLEEKILSAMIRDSAVYEKIRSSVGLDFFSNIEYNTFIQCYDSLQGSSDSRIEQMVENDEDLPGQVVARVVFILDECSEPDPIEVDNFIRKIMMNKSRKYWQMIYQKLNALNGEGDFKALMNFILDLDTILNNTREGGI